VEDKLQVTTQRYFDCATEASGAIIAIDTEIQGIVAQTLK
jgi:hypothetical protein